MRIAVLGTGDVGGTLGKRWAQKGHQVIFGSRNPHDDKVRELLAEAGPNSRAAGNALDPSGRRPKPRPRHRLQAGKTVDRYAPLARKL